MATEGLDYSFSRPVIAQMAADGIKFVVRYLSTGSKGITAAELDALHAAGIAVVLVYEAGGQMALGGYAAGVRDAKTAAALARALGAPAGVAIYFAVDFDPVGQTAAIMEYFRGLEDAKTGYPVGIYGAAGIVQAVKGAHAVYGWETYAWSHGVVTPSADLYQYQNGQNLYGANVDKDRSLHADYGAWLPNGKTQQPTPPKTEDGFTLNAQDEQKIQDIVQAAFDHNRDKYAIRVCQRLMARIGQSLFNHSVAQGNKLSGIKAALDKLVAK